MRLDTSRRLPIPATPLRLLASLPGLTLLLPRLSAPLCVLLALLLLLQAPAASRAADADRSAEPGRAAASDTAQTWQPPVPTATGERRDERERMLREQIAWPGAYRTRVSDPAVLAAMRSVPRHVFVPERLRDKAYRDSPLPIGLGQTISQPYIVAYMTELLALDPTKKVLEIGTGSGYQAAVLAQLTPQVYSIEIIEPLWSSAKGTLRAQGYQRISLKHADGYFGWPEAAPFDAIIVTCAAGHVPAPLWKQLKPGGRLVIPLGGTYSVQRLVVIEKTPDGKRLSRSEMGVRFVPMTGEAEQP